MDGRTDKASYRDARMQKPMPIDPIRDHAILQHFLFISTKQLYQIGRKGGKFRYFAFKSSEDADAEDEFIQYNIIISNDLFPFKSHIYRELYKSG